MCIKKSHSPIIWQILSRLPPRGAVSRLVEKFGTEKHSKGFSSWDHFIAMLFSQISGADSLRDTIGGMSASGRLFRGSWLDRPPNKSTLSYANTHRDWRLFEAIFYETLKKFENETAYAKKHRFRFTNKLMSLDSTVITLCYRLFDWAKYRTAKGGLKIHILLDNSFRLPQLVGVSTADQHDIIFAKTLALPKGTIVAMDRGYNDYSLFYKWTGEGVFFVTRLKDRAVYSVTAELEVPPVPDFLLTEKADEVHDPRPQKEHFVVVKDQIIRLTGPKALKACPIDLRLVTAVDPNTGKEYRFLSNLMPESMSCHLVAAIYKDRWQVENFFKIIKQNMVIKTFLGVSENAVRCQIFAALTAMLVIARLKYEARIRWNFSNLIHLLRLNLFTYLDLSDWIDRPHCERPPPLPDESPLQYHKLF
jgi:hypothetical protein